MHASFLRWTNRTRKDMLSRNFVLCDTIDIGWRVVQPKWNKLFVENECEKKYMCVHVWCVSVWGTVDNIISINCNEERIYKDEEKLCMSETAKL